MVKILCKQKALHLVDPGLYCMYVGAVRVTFSAAKDAINRRKHKVSLQRAEDFDFESACFDVDDREDHTEERWNAIGFLGVQLTFTLLGMEHIRAISLRKARPDEEERYNDL